MDDANPHPENLADERSKSSRLTRLTVYLGADLVERLAPLREQMNMSKIAQEALEAKVVEMEREAGMGERKAQIIDRLRQALSPYDRARQAGRNEGRNWAETRGSWTEIKDVVGWTVWDTRWAQTPDEIPYVYVEVDNEPLNMPEGATHPRYQLEEEYRADPKAYDKWLLGFREGVREIFDFVAGEMEPGYIDPDDIPF